MFFLSGARGLVSVLLGEAAARRSGAPHPWLGVDFRAALDRYGFSWPWASVGDCPGWALEGRAQDPVTAAEAAAALRAAAEPANDRPFFVACNLINPRTGGAGNG